ncbi:MAG: pseudaminic acid cytidylyltransferase [Lachnospiraceae bacterium]|nr:pseudaminic acid cytidylyltransferase [Lachnospiraceae bacterium]
MKSLALITARGGSRRIPHKNIKEFAGKPMISYAIEAAKAAGVFEHVMVSTDDEKIAEVAREYGAEVPFMRSAENADDNATTADVIKEVLEAYEERGESFDGLCCIYPTAAFVTADAIREAMEALYKGDADSVMPVVRFSFPPRRALLIRDGRLVPHYPEDQLKRSQDLESEYHDCGQFYAIRVSSFKEQGKVVMEKTLPLIVPEERVQDIDTPEDWAMAELKFRMLTGRGEE